MAQWTGLSQKPMDDASRLAIRAWNMMGGELRWADVGEVADILGAWDAEELVDGLLLIAGYVRDLREQEMRKAKAKR